MQGGFPSFQQLDPLVLANFASFAMARGCASEAKVGFNYGCGFGIVGLAKE